MTREKARADAAEREAERWEVCAKDLHAERDQLAARLPAEMPGCTIRFVECSVGHGRLTADNWVDSGCLVCERDQLAARAKELEAMVPHPGDGSCERCGFAPVTNGLCSDSTCTPEERKVLEAMARADITFDTHGHRRAIFDNSLHEILACEAELANRAAKAKREAK